MANVFRSKAGSGERHGDFNSALLPVADAATHRKIDEVLRAAYKKFGRGKFIRKALALGLRKHRLTT